MYYKPWIGKQYPETRLLLVSESAYDWRRHEALHSPMPEHPTEQVKLAIEDLGAVASYYTAITKAISDVESPSSQERQKGWNDYAYSIFIPGTVGQGTGAGRTAKMWREGGKDFLSLLEELKPTPKKAIITSLRVWGKMPKTQVHHPDNDRIEAYRIKSGDLVWCLAVPHPANRTEGFRWKDVAKCITDFRCMPLEQC